jgi:hypothetical protein
MFVDGKNDTLFVAAQEFADNVLKTKAKINYADTTWIAVAQCHGKFNGKDTDFMLILNLENRGKDMYKWVISKAEGDIFALTPSYKSDMLMIMPDDHETNFMSLKRITADQDNLILNYSQKDYNLDQTSVFFSFVNQGLLDIEYVSDLQFIFFQVKGWQFTIKEINRYSKNSGWLITSFSKINDDDKEKIISNILNTKR